MRYKGKENTILSLHSQLYLRLESMNEQSTWIAFALYENHDIKQRKTWKKMKEIACEASLTGIVEFHFTAQISNKAVWLDRIQQLSHPETSVQLYMRADWICRHN